ncbi:MAG: hypothetical protein A2Y10_09020 [Planctomycetes bacterium GWF2_41_51]|nr:MAG: hypothetical protein A2Y10_09020 [Planctomycetes bacterium GWF2_41_51]
MPVKLAMLFIVLLSMPQITKSACEDILQKTVLHIDASDKSTVDMQDSYVVSCKSKSGQYKLKSVSPESSPLYITNVVNGKAAFSFDGQNDFLAAEIPNDIRLGSLHIFIAGKLNKIGKRQYFVGADPNARFDILANNKEFLIELGIEAHAIRHGLLVDQAPHVFELSHFMPQKIYGQIPPGHYLIDGKVCGRPFSKSSDKLNDILLFGANNRGKSGYLNGYIFEIIIFDYKLTNDEQNSIRSYLGSKWGISIFSDDTPEPTIKLKEVRIGPDGKYSSLGIYNESPESPDGKRITYIVFDEIPTNQRPLVPFSIWVCDSNLANHRLVRKSENPTDNHNGAFQQWVDDDSIAYCSSHISELPDGSQNKREIRVFNVDTGQVEFGPFTDGFLGDNTVQGRILMNIDGDSSNVGPRGVYELNTHTGKVRCIYKVTDFAHYAANLNWYGMKKNPERWVVTHARFSPEASRISFMFNAGGSQYLFFTCKENGSDLKYWGVDKPLHELWFDEKTLCGTDEITDDNHPDNLRFRRWNLNKQVIETLAGQVNHTAFSPDRQWFAGESFYRSDPVKLFIYKRGEISPVAVIFEGNAEVVWQNVGHINPAFSRDGNRLYYNRTVGDLKQAYFCDISELAQFKNE